MKNKTKILQEITDKLFSLMSTKAKAEVIYDKKNETFVVKVEAGDETGLLIGKKGETLLGIQTVLGFLFKQNIGEWNRVLVNVGDYREKEESYLKEIATTTAERAKETGQPQNLYNLKPWQRRLIHLALSEDKEIITESEGEGEERFLIIKTKK
jgi:spoIIIJ-associated protein